MRTKPTRRSSPQRKSFSTLVDAVRTYASSYPSRKALIYLRDGEVEHGARTFLDLDLRASKIAQQLRTVGATGARALLLYPHGLDFVDGFLGALYGGVIAVPAYPPRNQRGLPRIQAIVADADASIILTTQQIKNQYQGMLEELPELKQLRWLATDAITNDDAIDGSGEYNPSSDSVAFLQYTSGSTGSPKGVMVSHVNLLYNSKLMYETWGHSTKSIIVSWMPFFHDMGLVLGILQPLYGGFTGVLMAPAAFIQRPARWLQAITKYRATTSGGPNFAYDLCARKIAPELLKEFDLNSWQVAINGAEPVRWESIEKFSETFAQCGFQRKSLNPCYGLAEGTLFVSGGAVGDGPARTIASESSLEKGLIESARNDLTGRSVVDCGTSLEGQDIVIANPDLRIAVEENTVGEIWVRGPSVAKGYWNKPEETSSTFHACLSDSGAGPFLRTGDLGFISQGRVFVTGRLKDLIIIRGRNLYPQDIEAAVAGSHISLRSNATAAFAIDCEGDEELVVVQELEFRQKPDYNGVIDTIQTAILEEFDVKVVAIILIRPGSIPKTSSGKIQRKATRQAFLDANLDIVYSWYRPRELRVETEEAFTLTTNSDVEEHHVDSVDQNTDIAVIEWLKTSLARRLGISALEIDTQRSFSQYGLDSADIVDLAGKLEDKFKKPVPPTLFWDHPTIEAFGRFLSDGRPNRLTEQMLPKVTQEEPIAIIGLGCRFPGADGPQAFWTLLSQGSDAITEVPGERWSLREFYGGRVVSPGTMNTRWGGFLERIDAFDAAFFGIAPREVERMDPQQRLLLEVTWEALEHAGIPSTNIAGSETGVFVGISTSDYSYIQLSDPTLADAYAGTGNAHSIAANRISYILDLHGPSIAIDTACSSSLVAVHSACHSLRNGECELALAGGVNVILNPGLTVAFSQARMMAADGRCKTFDESADGYVRGEGCGIVVLKRLSSAVRDGNRIFALIRGSSVNQDGKSNGLTAPNGLAQQQVIKRALNNARVAPRDISYVEVHGTGTALGDPIEVGALQEVLSEGRRKNDTCGLGSVKTNIGHLESAAGIASLIKVVLSLFQKKIPPNLHFCKLNPKIVLDGTHFYIPVELRSWDVSDRTRIAGVSSFGFGGTNAHVVLQEYIDCIQPRAEIDRPLHLLCLSGKTQEAVKSLVGHYIDFAVHNRPHRVADLCYSANEGRTHFDARVAVITESTDRLRSSLQLYQKGGESEELWYGTPSGVDDRVVFLFSGEGAYRQGGAASLYATQPTFRRVFDECDRVLQLPIRLTEIFQLESKPWLRKTATFIQPALFALEYSLARMWISWGIKPAAVVGNSLGEYVAACVAGIFSFESGLMLVAERGRLMDTLSIKGSMAAVFAPIGRVEEILLHEHGRVVVAALNGSQHTVIAGPDDAMRKAMKHFEEARIVVQSLDTSHAFHSPLIEPMLEAFEGFASGITCQNATVPFVSNLLGTYCSSPPDGQYWRAHTCQPVKFAQGIAALIQDGHRTFLEIGPADMFSSIARDCGSDNDAIFLSTLRRNCDEWRSILEVVANFYVRGIAIDWKAFDKDYQRKRIDLPPYPFNRQQYWFNLKKQRTDQQHRVPLIHPRKLHPYVGTSATTEVNFSAFACDISAREELMIIDHRVGEKIVFPGVAYIEAALVAGRYHFKQAGLQLKNVVMRNPMIFDHDEHRTLEITIRDHSDDRKNGDFRIISRLAANGYSETIVHCHGEVTLSGSLDEAHCVDVSTVKSRCGTSLSAGSLYDSFAQVTLNYGATFRVIDTAYVGTNEVLTNIKLNLPRPADFMLHPAILDGALQTFGVLLLKSNTASQHLYIPYAVDQVSVFDSLDTVAHAYATLTQDATEVKRETDVAKGDVFLTDRDGKTLVAMHGVRLKRVSPHQAASLFGQEPSRPRDELNKSHAPEEWFFDIKWVVAPPIKQETGKVEKIIWWLLADTRGVCDALAARLHCSGRHCIRVQRGARFARLNEDTFVINPDSEDSYRQLACAMEAYGCRNTVVNLWSCDDVSATTALGTASHFRQTEWYRFHLFARTLGVQHSRGISIWLITNYGQGINETRHVIPEHTIPWAFGRVLNKEYQNIQCSGLDIEFNGHDTDQWAEIVHNEILGSDQRDVWIAYHNGNRLMRVCVPRSVLEDKRRALPLKEGGVYLISGGQNGIGLEIAKYIASKVTAKLVLINRTLLDGASHPGRLEEIQSLRDSGIEVWPFRGDVTSVEEMQSLVAGVVQKWGKIDGVVHAAGVLRDGLIAKLSYEDYEQVLRPKVAGASVLDETTGHLPLDFFILFSSMASIFSPKGQCGHVIANAYLDAYAHYRRLRRSGMSMSINWGAWGETGVVASERYRRILQDQGIHPLTTLEGISAFDTLLRTNAVQIAYCGFKGNRRDAFIQSFRLFKKGSFENRNILNDIVSQVQSNKLLHNGIKLMEYEAMYEDLDAAMLQRAWDVFRELGWNPQDRAQRNAREVVRRLGILPKYEKLVQRILHHINEKQETLERR